MATYSSANVGFVLVDGYNLLGYLTTLTANKIKRTEPTTTLGDSWEEHSLTGLSSFEMMQNGFFDDANDASNEALLANSASRTGAIALEGNTAAKKFIGISGTIQDEYERIASVGGLHKAAAAYKANGIIHEAVIIATLAARALAASPVASVDNGAGSTSDNNGAYLQVTVLTLGGWTSITIKLRSSTDNVTFGDLYTFTTVTAAPSAQYATFSSVVNRYVHTTMTGVGAGAGESITFMTGLFRGA